MKNGKINMAIKIQGRGKDRQDSLIEKSLLYVLPFAPICAYCYYLIEMFLDGVAEFCTPSTWEAETGNFP